MTTSADRVNSMFAEFDWDTYFAKLDRNPKGNAHAGCDHGSGYCATTPNNVFTGRN